MIPIKLTNDTWPPKDGEFCSSIVLYYDNWNDYSYRTSFVMCYCDADGMVREVGNVKIYYWQNDEVRTNQYSEHTKSSLGDHIESLSASYCSLGQELSYYKNLKAPQKIATGRSRRETNTVLKPVRHCANMMIISKRLQSIWICQSPKLLRQIFCSLSLKSLRNANTKKRPLRRSSQRCGTSFPMPPHADMLTTSSQKIVRETSQIILRL